MMFPLISMWITNIISSLGNFKEECIHDDIFSFAEDKNDLLISGAQLQVFYDRVLLHLKKYPNSKCHVIVSQCYRQIPQLMYARIDINGKKKLP